MDILENAKQDMEEAFQKKIGSLAEEKDAWMRMYAEQSGYVRHLIRLLSSSKWELTLFDPKTLRIEYTRLIDGKGDTELVAFFSAQRLESQWVLSFECPQAGPGAKLRDFVGSTSDAHQKLIRWSKEAGLYA